MLWLIEWLPDTGAFYASVRGGVQQRGWTADRYIAAYSADTLAVANYQRNNGKGRKPKPIPRPTNRKRPRVVTVAELNGG